MDFSDSTRVTDNSPLDAAPTDGLERAFELPAYIAEDEVLSDLYAAMVDRLRHEADGLPMPTMQHILMERIATKYVLIKYHEYTGWTGMGVSAERDANAQWLDLVKEWNRLLAAGEEKLRDALLLQMSDIFIAAVEELDKEEDKRKMRRVLSASLAKAGL